MTRQRERHRSAPARATALVLGVLVAVLLCSAEVDALAGWFQTTLDTALAIDHGGTPRIFDASSLLVAAILPAGCVIMALWQRDPLRFGDLPAAPARLGIGSARLARTAVTIDSRASRGP